MTIQQVQKIEEIRETLERLQMYINKETYHILLNGKKGYINDMFKNVDDMFDELFDNDTPDIIDAGINDYGINEHVEN